MTRLPAVSARALMAALERAGFARVRSKGGHHFYRHRDDATRQTTVPVHSGDLPPGTLRAILKQARIGPEDFLELL